MTRKIHRHHADPADERISAMLKERLPQAPANPWFVRKVMNRLPDKPRPLLSLPEAICYAAALIGLAGAWGYAYSMAMTDGMTMTVITLSGILTLLTLFVIGIFTFPMVRRALT